MTTGSDMVAQETARGSEEGTALSAAACLFRSLADPSRLSILRHLALGEHRVVDLMAHLGLAQATVSGHLACLRDCGLVTSRPQGRASLFSLAVGPELLELLVAAERVLAATGDAVTLCPTYGADSTADAGGSTTDTPASSLPAPGPPAEATTSGTVRGAR
nr:metalloregulator ArsR/SmtB family transcription factor [uncultured Pseudokineococcus sp.]